ncbi:MAG: HNH endonuclease [Candidatus Eisenbacteria bacterium]|nr:HNH endonuclease [Candidatus Eisenbacteria bacterium]
MSPPSAEAQLRFLANIQRLLDEGIFTATYKFALLMALADLAVEKGDDSGAPLPLATEEIAEKFVAYYWRQGQPYVRLGSEVRSRVLRQNTGRQAKVISLVSDARGIYDAGSPRELAPDRRAALIRDVARTVETMPLWKLQVMGGEVVPFLYENLGRGHAIVLREGVAFCLRRFHALIRGLAQGAWVRFVRNLRGNRELLGETADLSAFLFGTERAVLSAHVPILQEIQSGLCFYCRKDLRAPEVDHFVPWSRYPVDLGHNFVLACRTCNGQKRDFLAAVPHLERWLRRNEDHRHTLEEQFEQHALAHSLGGSLQIARWAYGQVEQQRGSVWVAAERFEALGAAWRKVLAA